MYIIIIIARIYSMIGISLKVQQCNYSKDLQYDRYIFEGIIV